MSDQTDNIDPTLARHPPDGLPDLVDRSAASWAQPHAIPVTIMVADDLMPMIMVWTRSAIPAGLSGMGATNKC